MSEKNPSGAIHPTIFLVLWFAIGFGLHEIAPLELTGPGFLDTLETGVVVIGIGLFAWSAFEVSHPSPPPSRPWSFPSR